MPYPWSPRAPPSPGTFVALRPQWAGVDARLSCIRPIAGHLASLAGLSAQVCPGLVWPLLPMRTYRVEPV